MRLLPVTNWPKDNLIDCPGCSLRVKGKQVTHGRDQYLETPSHRAIGVRENRHAIDWSNV